MGGEAVEAPFVVALLEKAEDHSFEVGSFLLHYDDGLLEVFFEYWFTELPGNDSPCYGYTISISLLHTGH